MEAKMAQPDASSHLKNFVGSTVGAHPVFATLVIAFLVLVILIMGFYMLKYQTQAEKCSSSSSKFGGNAGLALKYAEHDAPDFDMRVAPPLHPVQYVLGANVDKQAAGDELTGLTSDLYNQSSIRMV